MVPLTTSLNFKMVFLMKTMPGSSRFLLDKDFERWLESQGSSEGSVGIGACFNLSNRIGFCPFYSVQGVPSELRLGFVDLDFKCSTVCPTMLGLMGIWQKQLARLLAIHRIQK